MEKNLAISLFSIKIYFKNYFKNRSFECTFQFDCNPNVGTVHFIYDNI